MDRREGEKENDIEEAVDEARPLPVLLLPVSASKMVGAGCNTIAFVPPVPPPLPAPIGAMPGGTAVCAPFEDEEELELIPSPKGLILSGPRLKELGRRVRDLR